MSKETGTALKELDASLTRHSQQIIADVDQITLRKIDYTLQRVTWLVILVIVALALGAWLCLRSLRSIVRRVD